MTCSPDQTPDGLLHSETCRMIYFSNSASAAGGFMAQSGNNVPVTCRSSVGRRRTAASPSCQLELPTHRSRRRSFERTSGPPWDLTFGHAAERVGDGDSGHSRSPQGHHGDGRRHACSADNCGRRPCRQ